MALLFLLPLVTFDILYVRRSSPSIREFRNEELELGIQAATANVLVLGNSIPRRWHPWLAMTTNPHFLSGSDDGVLNLGLGGATALEWAFLLEKALQTAPRLKRVYVVGNDFVFNPTLDQSSYLPLAISYRELLAWALHGRAATAELLYLFQAKTLASVGARGELLYSFYSAFVPGYAELSEPLEAARPPPASGGDAGALEERRLAVYRRMAGQAAAAGATLTFILAPMGRVGEKRRMDIRDTFRQLCFQGGFDCHDFSGTFPEAAFEADQAHLKFQEGRDFFRRVMALGAGR